MGRSGQGSNASYRGWTGEDAPTTKSLRKAKEVWRAAERAMTYEEKLKALDEFMHGQGEVSAQRTEGEGTAKFALKRNL